MRISESKYNRDIIEYILSNNNEEERRFLLDIFYDNIDLITHKKRINFSKSDIHSKKILEDLSYIWLCNKNITYTDPLEILSDDNEEKVGFSQSQYCVLNSIMFSFELNHQIATITFGNQIISTMTRIKNYFSYKQLINILKLQNVLSYRLYIYLYKSLLLQKGGEVLISVEGLRNIFGTNDKYPEFRDFRKYILDKAIKDISTAIGCTITYSKILTNQKVTELSIKMD